MKTKTLSCLAVAALMGATAPIASATNVGLELILLVDVSGSVDNNEYLLQRNGYVNAFNNPTIQGLISTLGTQSGGMAVTYIEWSGASQQSVEVAWSHLYDNATASAFATAIAGATRNFTSGLTAPGSAINFAYPQFGTNAFTGTHQVIDVSGDGAQNDGATTSTARGAALAAGVERINGLAIGDATLQAWYAANIQGGTNSFTISAPTFQSFETAIERKLRAEITNTSVPDGGTTLALLGTALAGLFGLRRKFHA